VACGIRLASSGVTGEDFGGILFHTLLRAEIAMRPAIMLLLLATAAGVPAMESTVTGGRGGTATGSTTGSVQRTDHGLSGSSTTNRTFTSAEGKTGGVTTDRDTSVTKTDSGVDLNRQVTHTTDSGASATRTGTWQAQRNADGSTQVDGTVTREPNGSGRHRRRH
jgi:hypothetical protein